MTQEQNQSPCDHPEPCACFAEGNYVGRESAHRQLREWLPEDHERDCMCEPCRTAIAVLQAFQPGIIDYRDVATLYAERGGRQSRQTPYGDFNYDDRPAPERTAGMLRVSYIHDTGDWYATHPVEGGRALLIGNITPLAPWGAHRRVPGGLGPTRGAGEAPELVPEDDCPVQRRPRSGGPGHHQETVTARPQGGFQMHVTCPHAREPGPAAGHR